MEVKSTTPKMRQKQEADDLGFSDSTIKRNRRDKNMNNPYHLHDSERSQVN